MASNFPSGRPRNTLGFSLGAVGGPRGTGAGITRAILQFITQYDRGNLEQLGKDLQKLQSQQAANNAQLQSASTRQQAIEAEINKAKTLRERLDSNGLKTLKSVIDLQKTASLEESKRGRVSQTVTANLTAQERAFRSLTGLNSAALNTLTAQASNQQRLNVVQAQTNALKTEQVALEEQINGVMEQGIAIASARSQLFSQVGGLVMGAVGGAVGGAIVGAALYAPIQAAMDSVANFAKDVTDPSHRAREAIDDLGKSINGMVDDDTLTRLAAAQKYISQIQSPTAQGVFNPGVLGAAAQAAAYKDLIDELTKYKDLLGGGIAATEKKQQDNLALLLAQIDMASGKVHALTVGMEGYAAAVAQQNRLGAPDFTPAAQGGPGFGAVVDYTYYLGQAQNMLNDLDPSKIVDTGTAAQDAADRLKEAADAAQELRDELNQTAVSQAFDASIQAIENNSEAAIDGIRRNAEANIEGIRATAESNVNALQKSADARINALQRQSQNLEVVDSRRTKNLEASLKALSNAGPSARTRELASAIERLNAAQEKAQYRQQLADIDEQRHQVLLKQRLALSDKEINLDHFHGQDRLIAIDALLKRMQEQNEKQAQFNKLLDIQYNISQGVKRQQGETIQDFIARRAQYYRDQLQQAAELRTQGPTAELEAEKEQLQTTLELRDLTTQKSELIEQHRKQQYLKSLQEQLQASQKRDQEELQHRRDMLQAELQASREADQKALQQRRQAIQDEITRIRQNTQDKIQQINKTRDADIQAAEDARDATIKNVQRATDVVVQNERTRADQIKQWSSYAESQRLIEAIQGANDVDEVYRFGGQLAGSGFSAADLQAQLQALGVAPSTIAAVVADANRIHAIAAQKIYELQTGGKLGPPSPGYLHGGAFMLRNSQQSPFGTNIRHGEDGRDEIGVILSNRVIQTMRETGFGNSGQPLVGSVVFGDSKDPFRDQARFERRVRSIVREELKN